MCKRSMIMIFALVLCAFENVWAHKTTLSAEVYGYQRDMVYFDCVQTPSIRQEFHTNPGEEHLYSFDTNNLVALLINGRTEVLLQPGDSLHVKINYEGKVVQSIDYSGSPRAVEQNRLLWNIAQLKRDMRYKAQLLACATVDVKPKNRIQDSRVLLNKVHSMLAEAEKKNLSADVMTYILSSIESEAYLSFIEYPVMYAEIRKLPIEKQEIGNYWKIMDGCKLRNDNAALRNPEYLSFLMRYCFFENERKAHEKGAPFAVPTQFEEMYKELASFYADQQRDAVLYTLICNFIREGRDIERAETLYKDYKKNYNKDKEYIQILEGLLQ